MWERGEKKEKDWERERERGVNRVSEQGLVPLDVAALTHNSPLLHVLTKAGARHNPVCESNFVTNNIKTVSDAFKIPFLSRLRVPSVYRPAEWALKLDALVALAGKRVEERKMELQRKAGPGPQAQADVHRHIHLWSLRLQLYCRMRENFQNTGQWSWFSLWRFLNYSSGRKPDHRPASFQSSLAVVSLHFFVSPLQYRIELLFPNSPSLLARPR